MTLTPSAAQVLGRVILVTGKEEFLSERTVRSVRDAVRQHDGEAEFSEANAGDLTLATLGEMSAPSLFSTNRCVVVRKLEDLPEETVDGLVAYCQAPVEDVAVVLVHSGGQKGSGVLAKLINPNATVTVVKSEEIKARQLPAFVTAEAASQGARITSEATAYLITALGADLRGLAAAVHQLVFDFPGEQVTLPLVQRYFGGRAEAKSFDIADAAFAGRRAKSLEDLRWALEGGTAGVLVTSAMALSARRIARFLSAPRGMREADLAKELGVPPFGVKSVRAAAQRWDEATIGTALRAVALADADIKGQAHDAQYTLERLVLTVSGLAASRR